MQEESVNERISITDLAPAVGARIEGFDLSRPLSDKHFDTIQETLADRGYTYDGSTLPTWIGPLARAYYFRQAKLTAEQREERSMLFRRHDRHTHQVTGAGKTEQIAQAFDIG